MTALLRECRVEVGCKGELVLLRFGDQRYSIEFPVALQVAAAVHHEALAAKATAGFAEWSTRRGFGVLHDAAATKPKRKRFMEKLPAILLLRDIGVRAVGTMVALRFGSQTRDIYWNDALALAQWLRVRGKEARNNAGETAHWSKIANFGQSVARA